MIAAMQQAIFWLTLVAALGTGVVGGVFFAFSSFVMKSLARIAPNQGIAAMQSINIVVINPSFMLALFGTALLCIGLAIWAGINWARAGSAWIVGGAVLYVIGTAVWTIVFHVPRNDALAKIDPNAPESIAIWEQYVSVWTLGNHVRTAAAIAACACFVLALVRRAAEQNAMP